VRASLPGPGRIAAATAAIGGLLIVAIPEHASAFVQLGLVTVATGAALHALSSQVPPSGWISPFKWLSPFAEATRPAPRRHGSDEIESIHARLSDRRQRIAGAPPLPPDALRLLRPVIAASAGVDPTDRREMAAARRRLSSVAWSILATEPLRRPSWFRTVRPNAWEVTDVVHDVLDELDELPESAHGPERARDPHLGIP